MSLTWRDFALCDGAPEENYFSPDKVKESTLVSNCDGCPVKRDCLEDALSYPTEEDWGVWGGTTRNERAAIREGALQHATRALPLADLEALDAVRRRRHLTLVPA